MLKTYQEEAVSRLDTFCSNLNTKSIGESFKNLTSSQYLEVEGFDNPYVCIRIPTGGGKTLIASKSIRVLVNEYLNRDYHLVFWLAPSEKIVTQTLEALKDKRHFYRKILDQEFDNINVMSINESYKQKFDPTNELVIIIGTIQSFRTTSKDGRKFYEENSNYYELLKQRDITPSLENVMKHYKPIVILDEAHKSSTGLSLERLLDLEPSFILELTATPITKTSKAKGIFASNILYSVTATELKKESMIKLPILLKTLDDSLGILKDGIEKREYLEKLAKIEESLSDRYIRPINLIRADENRGENSLTYDKIKKLLIENFKIDESHIAVHTGNKKELDGIDLLSPNCKIRYIITVDALKEGWDCPFAYVLSVVSNMESKTAIEQLIGRVLRMPYIEEKNRKELGYSYVFVASDSFEKVANSIGQTLINSGFEEMEAKISIDRSSNSSEDDNLYGLFGDSIYEDRQIQLKEEDINIDELSKPSIEPYININRDSSKLSIVNIPSKSKREKFKTDLKKAISEEHHKRIDEIFEEINSLDIEKIDAISDIELPKLMIEYDGEILEFEESVIFDYMEIGERDLILNSSLTIDEFDIELNEHIGIIDIENNKLKKQNITSKRTDLIDFVEDKEISEILQENKIVIDNQEAVGRLSADIAKNIVKEDGDILRIFESKALKTFIYLVIDDLVKKRDNIDLTLLISKKYQLKRAILQKLKKLIIDSKNRNFSKLFEKDVFMIEEESKFIFTPTSYNPNPDKRSSNFKKHRYKNVHKIDSEEEYEVALYIDQLESVSTWIRNIDRDYQNSFWLQTATDKFYPDFIIHLKNGKTVVAEYKGEVYISEYKKTKEPIGKAWGSLCENCEFISLYKDNFKSELVKVG